ncbi:MAG: hypothetical protein QG656_163 [Candidatus Hydrogenedentes bacterium]|nr:hypothetical protein [Candidatus Hydrogenedentota bacterium]
MGFSSERVLLDILVGLPLVLCLSPLVFKLAAWIDARLGDDPSEMRGTLLLCALLIGTGIGVMLLLNWVCTLFGWPASGPWPAYIV